jgi:hypothetical protein
LCRHNFLSPYKKSFENNIFIRINHHTHYGKDHFTSEAGVCAADVDLLY